jgi:hypothetical protein
MALGEQGSIEDPRALAGCRAIGLVLTHDGDHFLGRRIFLIRDDEASLVAQPAVTLNLWKEVTHRGQTVGGESLGGSERVVPLHSHEEQRGASSAERLQAAAIGLNTGSNGLLHRREFPLAVVQMLGMKFDGFRDAELGRYASGC